MMGTELNVTVCLAGVVLAVGVAFIMDAVMTRIRQSRTMPVVPAEDPVGAQTSFLP
jgi:hypothetical protein